MYVRMCRQTVDMLFVGLFGARLRMQDMGKRIICQEGCFAQEDLSGAWLYVFNICVYVESIVKGGRITFPLMLYKFE